MNARPTDCPFCSIVSGSDTDAAVVARGDRWVAFIPLDPATRGHTLVVPRDHHEDWWAAPADVIAEVARATHSVGRVIQDALGPQGVNLITSAGRAAEQTIFHLHVHLIPRWVNDAMGPIWPEKGLSEGEASGTAEVLRKAWSLVQDAGDPERS